MLQSPDQTANQIRRSHKNDQSNTFVTVANMFLTYQTFVTNLHLLRVELHCKLQEKLHHVIEPLASPYSVCWTNLSQRDLSRKFLFYPINVHSFV